MALVIRTLSNPAWKSAFPEAGKQFVKGAENGNLYTLAFMRTYTSQQDSNQELPFAEVPLLQGSHKVLNYFTSEARFVDMHPHMAASVEKVNTLHPLLTIKAAIAEAHHKEKGFYSFISGQSSHWGIYTEFLRRIDSNPLGHNSMRDGVHYKTVDDLSEFIMQKKKMMEKDILDTSAPDPLKDRVVKLDQTDEVRNHLISATANLWVNVVAEENPLYWFAANSACSMNSIGFIRSLMIEALEKRGVLRFEAEKFMESDKAKELFDEIVKIADQRKAGNLLYFVMEKSDAEELTYDSFPFGHPTGVPVEVAQEAPEEHPHLFAMQSRVMVATPFVTKIKCYNICDEEHLAELTANVSEKIAQNVTSALAYHAPDLIGKSSSLETRNEEQLKIGDMNLQIQKLVDLSLSLMAQRDIPQ